MSTCDQQNEVSLNKRSGEAHLCDGVHSERVRCGVGSMNSATCPIVCEGQSITNDCVYCVCVRSGNQQLYILS